MLASNFFSLGCCGVSPSERLFFAELGDDDDDDGLVAEEMDGDGEGV